MPDLVCPDTAVPPTPRGRDGLVSVVLADGPSEGEIRSVRPGATAVEVEAFTLHRCDTCPPHPGVAHSVLAPSETRWTTYRIRNLRYLLTPYFATEAAGTVRVAWSGQRPAEEEIRWYALFVLAWDGLMPWTLLPDHPAGPDHGDPIPEYPGYRPPSVETGCSTQFHLDEIRIYQGWCRCGWHTGPAIRRSLARLAQMCQNHELTSPFTRLYPAPVGTPIRPYVAQEPPVDGTPDSPEAGWTCAHVCGPDPDHFCDAAASTYIEYKNLAGGRHRMPLCEPCHGSEAAALAAARGTRTPDRTEGTP